MAIVEREPAASPVGRAMSLEEFLELPEAEPSLEQIDGVIRQKVSPKIPHGLLQFGLARRIDELAQERGLGVVVPVTRFKHAGWAPVPDLAFYRWERLPLKPDGTIADDLDVPPDLAVEIASPGQPVGELLQKCLWYVEHGVLVALLVQPAEAWVLAVRPSAQPRLLRGADRIDLDEVLPGFELTVAELFGFLSPRRPTRGQGTAERPG